MSEIETVWLQISSGRGPAECQLAVAKLAAEVERRARVQGLAAETVEVVAGEERGTALSALLKLTGDGASAFPRGWSGSVQWICQSPFRPGHKRKNWFVGVEVLGIVEPSAAARIDPRDVAFESMRASGAGGQHVNKTESAVRATHKPTGLVATAREERSQAMNKKLALARLQGLIDSGVRTEQERAERERWQQHDSLERGRPVRIFSGEEFRERRKIFSMSGGEVFRELSPPPLYFRFRSELRRRAFTEYPGYFNVIVSPQDEPRKFSGEYEASNR